MLDAAHTADGRMLAGRLLVAMPGIGDDRFDRTVVYLCAHSGQGAMGLVLNRPHSGMTVIDLLEQLEITGGGEPIRLPAAAAGAPVLLGGPVETSRGFVLHSADVVIDDSTLPITADVALTATLDILRAIAANRGPQRALLALGYAGWGPGQLERELLANGWLHCEADTDLVFATPPEAKYAAALARLGIGRGMLSPSAGRA